jgi:hypothetical protein
MRDDYQCEECKNTTKPDQFTCICLCLNCGPCDGECQYGKAKVQNIRAEAKTEKKAKSS